MYRSKQHICAVPKSNLALRYSLPCTRFHRPRFWAFFCYINKHRNLPIHFREGSPQTVKTLNDTCLLNCASQVNRREDCGIIGGPWHIKRRKRQSPTFVLADEKNPCGSASGPRTHPIAAKAMVTIPMHSSCTPVPTSTQNNMGYFAGGRNTSAWTSCTKRTRKNNDGHKKQTRSRAEG